MGDSPLSAATRTLMCGLEYKNTKVVNMDTLKTEGYSIESMSAWSGGSWRVVVC
jgi:hypothetical protein